MYCLNLAVVYKEIARYIASIPNEVLIVLISIILTAIANHVINDIKILKERQSGYKQLLGEKVFDALQGIRKIVTEAASIDYLDPDKTALDCKDYSAYKDSIFVPSIMLSKDTIFEFSQKVSSARAEYEPYLDVWCAAYLFIFEKYLLDFALFIKQQNIEELTLIGAMCEVDINTWCTIIDKHIVYRMNHPRYKIFSEYSFRWKLIKNLVEARFLKKSILAELIQQNSEEEI